jgi:hypothetical protein
MSKSGTGDQLTPQPGATANETSKTIKEGVGHVTAPTDEETTVGAETTSSLLRDFARLLALPGAREYVQRLTDSRVLHMNAEQPLLAETRSLPMPIPV